MRLTSLSNLPPNKSPNRRWRLPFRYRGSRRESAVAQLSTLGSIERTYFMKTYKDNKGHIYADVKNIRVTYIPAKDRDASKDWAGSDVVRVQAYKAPAPDRSLTWAQRFQFHRQRFLWNLLELFAKFIQKVEMLPNKSPGANRRWRLQFRYRGSRRESAVAQLSTLGD